MNILFKKVTPAPLLGVTDFNTEVWGQNLAFSSQNRYKINAPSGKGKSTFIHAIYGLRTDFEGEILLNNQSTKQIKSNEWAKIRSSKISIVFQDLRLFTDLTGSENLMVKTALNANLTQSNIDEMLDFLNVKHLVDKKASTMSYGERQRIAIIRALIQPFELLLLDEPFSHLDPENIKKACMLIDKVCTQNNAGLIITSLGYDYDLQIKNTLKL